MEHPKSQTDRRRKGEGSLFRSTKGIWQYSIMHNGKRQTRSLRTRDEVEARREYLKVRRNFDARIERGEFEPTTAQNVMLDEVLEDYLTYMRQNGRKSTDVVTTVVGKIRRAREFGNGERATRRVPTLQTADFKAYRRRVTAAGDTDSTVNHHFALIGTALRLGSRETPPKVIKIPHIPMVHVNDTRTGFLEYDDHYTLLEALPASLKVLFVIAFHSGCRLGEVLKMMWSDVDWMNRIIRLPETKNGRQRNLPMWGSIAEHLERQKAYREKRHPDCEALFFWMSDDVQLGRGGVRVAPGTPIKDFRESWAVAVTAAHKTNPNVPVDLLFHDLRRSGVRVMIQDAGIPEAQAMLISGHETRSMLDRYNIVSLKNVKDAGAKLDAWYEGRRRKGQSKVLPIKRSKSS
jgi:integrase